MIEYTILEFTRHEDCPHCGKMLDPAQVTQRLVGEKRPLVLQMTLYEHNSDLITLRPLGVLSLLRATWNGPITSTWYRALDLAWVAGLLDPEEGRMIRWADITPRFWLTLAKRRKALEASAKT